MRIAYFDCFSGISGDMTLGALLSCGAEEAAFRDALAGLRIDGYELSVQKRKVEGLMAVDVDVVQTTSDQGHGRELPDILAIYATSSLPPRVIERATAIFTRLAEAEAKVHGTTPDKIHFHEVGAIDAIVDITGTCILLEMLGVEAVYSAPIPYTRGFVKCQHGIMPLPAPATLELLLGLPTYPVDIRGELVTPTGAAILATLAGAERVGPPPAMVPRAIGWGSGKKDFGAPFPNLLRVVLADLPDARAQTPTEVVVLETNVDDATPEALGYAQERLLEEGALDVTLQPAQMKKNRPGTLVTVLASPERADAVVETLFRETGTFGIRRSRVEREVLDREFRTVATAFGAIQVKVGSRAGRVLVVAPEYEDCRRAARAHDVPLRLVYDAARAAS